MSAYLVSTDHIAEIVKWAKNPQQGNLLSIYNPVKKTDNGRLFSIDSSAINITRILAQANLDSLAEMYGDNAVNEEYINECLEKIKLNTNPETICISATINGGAEVGICDLTPADIYNMCCCLNYQSCEVDNWVDSDAYWLIQNIKNVAGEKMAGNAKVQWSYK